ncbi:MAG: GGDEF domain-containing protein, partial [Alphaproteobacteria bacterium]|nr:GGDEF domain-containing protein [Alphaproteobacteria bacterium]
MKMMDKFSTGENQDSQIESDSELSVEDRNASMAQHGVIVQQDLRSTLNNMERATAAFGLAGFSWNIPGDKVEYYGPWDALLPADKRKSLNIKSLLDILHPEDYGIIYLAFSDLMHGRVYSLEREARIETSENQPEQWILIRATSERNPHGGIQIIHGAVLDITSYKTTERQVAVMTQQDLMTGLPNRQQLLSKIELAQISHLSDSKDRRLELVVLDIDRFRLINESLGETAGDEVLRIVGERLKRQLRRDDTLARLSGDQFAFAILSDLNTDEDKLIRRLDKIRYLISEPINLSVDSGLSEPIVLEANIGIRRATTSEDISAEALLRDALLALREAKSNKSAQYAEFRHELHEELLISVKFEKTIRAALQNDWIDVHYQPVVESETGR